MQDIILNYTVLVLNIGVGAIPVLRHRDSTSTGYSSSNAGIRGAFLSLVFVIMFQISLCLFVKCAGISIVWCAIGGWILLDCWRRTRRQGTDTSNPTPMIVLHQATILVIDFVVIVYYAIVAELITTLAHM